MAAYRYRDLSTIVAIPAYDRVMRIAVLGGGPGGLYFAALAKQLDAGHDITVWERNAADDTFGFGVVFSDETLGGIEHADREIFAAMQREFARWDDIDVHFRGATFTSGGHGFAAMSRKRLLAILQARCAALGVRILFRTEAPDVAALTRGYDLVVASDGMNSATRSRFAAVPARPGAAPVQVHLARHRPGLRCVQVLHPGHPGRDHAGARLPVQRAGQHLHPGDARGRLAAGRVRRRGGAGSRARAERRGVDRDDPRPVRGRARRAQCGQHSLFANNSRWTAFTTVRCRTWRHQNVVLLGDAAHTAHFSIGSGTKLAMEDALALAACLHEQAGVDARAGRVRGGAPAGGRLDPAGRAGQPGVVREHRPVRRPGPAPVRLQHRDPQPPGHLRQPAAARPGVRGGHGPRGSPPAVALAARRAWSRGAAADVPAVPAGRPGAGEPGHRLADGHVLGAGRRAGRLPPGAPGQQGAGRGRAGDDRDGLRLPVRPDHARLHRHVHRGAGGVLAPDHGLRPRPGAARRSASSSATPAARARPG